jgi:hypothetical protein
MKQAGNEFGGEAIRVVGRTLVCSRSDRKEKELKIGPDNCASLSLKSLLHLLHRIRIASHLFVLAMLVGLVILVDVPTDLVFSSLLSHAGGDSLRAVTKCESASSGISCFLAEYSCETASAAAVASNLVVQGFPVLVQQISLRDEDARPKMNWNNYQPTKADHCRSQIKVSSRGELYSTQSE